MKEKTRDNTMLEHKHTDMSTRDGMRPPRGWMLRLLFLALWGICSVGQSIAQEADSLSQTDKKYLSLIDSSFVAGNRADFEMAASYLRGAISLQPKHPMNAYLMNNLGGIEQLLGRDDQALLAYDAALRSLPEERTIRYNRARLYERMGKNKAAITDLSLLIGQAPRDELYRYQRAMLYLLEGAYDLSQLDLDAILEGNGESLKARIGYALLETARERYDAAEQIYEFLVSKLPKSAEVYEGRARLYLARGMKGYAIRDINKAFELAGPKTSSTMYRLRGLISASIGDDKAAMQDERTAQLMERAEAMRRPSPQS